MKSPQAVGVVAPLPPLSWPLAGPAVPSAKRRLRVQWARHEDDVRAAQRLRYQVFVGEMRARLQVLPGTHAGHDTDAFDAHCEHLLVHADNPCNDSDDNAGQVVGTYRVLRPQAAARLGGLYADREFDLAPLRALRPTALELGRSCAHRDWRRGGVIMALWGALGQFMLLHRLDTAIGCASVALDDGGGTARKLWQQLMRAHVAASHWWVRPSIRLPLRPDDTACERPMPALIKGYLRCGAKALGPPALDAQFGSADFPMLMLLDEMPARYRQRLLDPQPRTSP